MTAILPEIQERPLETLARFEIEAFERARAGPHSHKAATLVLRREEARQSVLHHAIWLEDTEVARQQPRHVAPQPGMAIVGADEDWKALAYEATKVLLDVNKSRFQPRAPEWRSPPAI